MTKNEIKETVDTYFNDIEKRFHKILIHFNTDDIHQFRAEIKKLRAFFICWTWKQGAILILRSHLK